MARAIRFVKAKLQRSSDLLSSQCRMARAALQIGVRELAKAAQVSTNTVTRFERGEELKPRTVSALKEALEAAGVVFLANDEIKDGGPGVRLRQ